MIIAYRGYICSMYAAVLTADIVNSRKLGREALQVLLGWFRRRLEAKMWPYDFYRGDGFHTVVPIKEALVEACYWRCYMLADEEYRQLGVDVRISIGLGEVEDSVTDLASATGRAFELSGTELELITRERDSKLSIASDNELVNIGVSVIAEMVNLVLGMLTIRQSEVLGYVLLQENESTIASRLGKKQATVNRIKKAAHWHSLQYTLEQYKALATFNNLKMD
jgi:hypothetical protein